MKMVWRLSAGFALLATAAAAQPQQGPPVRTITQARGDLYKVQSGAGVAAVTVFLVTPERIVRDDPLIPESLPKYAR
jgi:hypothetical protein